MYKGPSALSGSSEQLSFYRKMAEIQEKLRRSEEERANLENKFTGLFRGSARGRNHDRVSNMRQEYASILDREKEGRTRNEKIFSSLENIERRTAVLNAKSEHLKLMRRQFDAYMIKMYPEFSRGRKNHGVQQSETFKAPPHPSFMANVPKDRQWQASFLSSPRQPYGSENNLPYHHQQDPYSYQKREENFYSKPATIPLNLSRHEQGHDDSDQGSLLWTSINDVKPLNLTMEETGRPSTAMRNLEDNLGRLLLDSAEKSPPVAFAAENEKEHMMMEKLSKISKDVQVMKEKSFEGDDAAISCHSSIGIANNSLDYGKEISPRKNEDILASLEESKEELFEAVLPEEEEDILYAETMSTVPDGSDSTEVVTHDITYSQDQQDYLQNISPEPPETSEVVAKNLIDLPLNLAPASDPEESVFSEESSPNIQLDDPNTGFVQRLQSEASQEPEYNYEAPPEQFSQEAQFNEEQTEAPQEVSQQEQPGLNMYGNEESSESTVPDRSPPLQQGESEADNTGFKEYELQPNPAEIKDEADTLTDYDSSEMTAALSPQQPNQEVTNDAQSVSQTSISDDVEQQMADILKHAPTSALPPVPPGRTGASPTSSWGKLKNLGATGALRTKPVSPTSSRAGSAKSSPGSKKSTTPPNKSPSNRSSNSSSGTRSPVAKKPSPSKK